MVNGVNGNQKSLSVLLQQKQKKLESINQQKQAVQEALNMENDKIAKAQVDLGDKKISLSEAIVALQNHPFKGMKAPDPSAPEYQIKKADGESFSEIDNAKFDKDMAEFKKAEAEYKALEAKVDKTTKDVELGDTAVKELTAIAQAKEEELKAKGADYEVTMGDIEDLNKQIDEAAKKETLDVTLTKDKNNDTLVEATVNQLKALQQKGLVDKNIDLNNLKPEQLKNLSEAIVKSDIKNKIVDAGTKTDGTSKDYTKMTAGHGRVYSVADMQEMAKALGADAENDEAGFAITSDDLKDLEAPKDDFVEIHAGDKPTVQNQKPEVDNGKIVLPRGVEYRVGSNLGKKADSLEDYGIVEKDGKYYRAKKDENGSIVPKDNKAFTADEVNKYFRGIEDYSGSNYSKYLDKAEKLGVNYEGLTPKELKKAVKAAEKEAKAEKKAKKQASVVADLKAYISAEKTETKKTTSKKVEVQKAEAATKKDQPAVQYEIEDAEVETKAKTKTASFNTDGTYTTKMGRTLSAQTVEEYIRMEHEMDAADYDMPAHDFEDTPSIYRSFKNKQAEEAVLNVKTKTSTSTAFDDFLNGKGFEDFNARSDAIANAKVTAHFRNGANVTGVTEDGIAYAGKQIISGSGTKAYLINGEYYALSSNGMPDLSKKLNKAEFEK